MLLKKNPPVYITHPSHYSHHGWNEFKPRILAGCGARAYNPSFRKVWQKTDPTCEDTERPCEIKVKGTFGFDTQNLL